MWTNRTSKSPPPTVPSFSPPSSSPRPSTTASPSPAQPLKANFASSAPSGGEKLFFIDTPSDHTNYHSVVRRSRYALFEKVFVETVAANLDEFLFANLSCFFSICQPVLELFLIFEFTYKRSTFVPGSAIAE